MISLRRQFGSREPILPQNIPRQPLISHAATVTVIALMAVAAYLTLERTIQVERVSATAIGLTQRQSMLSQRIASLTAQYALGTPGILPDLRGAIDAFESTHARLVGGDRSAGITAVSADPLLKALYFNGPLSLNVSARQYVAQARSIAAMSARDPALSAQVAPLLLAAQHPLLERLDMATRIRQDRAMRQSASLSYVGAGICATVFGTLLAGTLLVFVPLVRRNMWLAKEALELSHDATIDPLTGTLNKRSFQARGAIEIQKARRYHRPLSLLMIDADHLSEIEDAHGLDGGETILKALTSSFFDGTRISDLVGRVDDEQFAILLPETGGAGAELLAERLRRRVGNLAVPINDTIVSCTISVGVAVAEKDASFLWPTLKRADEALYEAKVRGRNRVVVAQAA